jgi:hypothetical protein
MYKGLVVFDVDGVIFKDIFLKKIVQSRGLFSHLRFITLGMRYYREKISIEELLQEGYRLAGTFSVEEAQGRISRRRSKYFGKTTITSPSSAPEYRTLL